MYETLGARIRLTLTRIFNNFLERAAHFLCTALVAYLFILALQGPHHTFTDRKKGCDCFR